MRARIIRVNLLATQAFVTVVNLGSLHRAADRLGVSSATVSRRLTELETELGARLVERSTRSLRVTDLGRAYYEQCRIGLDALADAHTFAATNGDRLRGTVRISCPPNLGPLLLPAIASVRAAHPGLHVLLVETERRLHQRTDDIDLFIRGTLDGNIGDDRLVARPLATYAHVLVASRQYIATAGAPRAPASLEQHSIVAFGNARPLATWDLTPMRGGGSVPVEVRPVFTSNDYTTVMAAVRAGMGIAKVPPFLYTPGPDLVRVLPGWTLTKVTMSLLFAADRMLSRPVRAVLDAILSTMPRSLAGTGKKAM